LSRTIDPRVRLLAARPIHASTHSPTDPPIDAGLPAKASAVPPALTALAVVAVLAVLAAPPMLANSSGRERHRPPTPP